MFIGVVVSGIGTEGLGTGIVGTVGMGTGTDGTGRGTEGTGDGMYGGVISTVGIVGEVIWVGDVGAGRGGVPVPITGGVMLTGRSG